jgi:hypothetical protein
MAFSNVESEDAAWTYSHESELFEVNDLKHSVTDAPSEDM